MDGTPIRLPMVPMVALSVFPNITMNFEVHQNLTIKALEAAMMEDQRVFLATRHDAGPDVDDPEDVYEIGTIACVHQVMHLSYTLVRVRVEGIARARLISITGTEPCMEAEVEPLEQVKADDADPRTEAMIRATYDELREYAKLARVSPEVLTHVQSSRDPGYIADYIAQHISMRLEERQSLLEELQPVPRLESLVRILKREVDVISMNLEIQNRVHNKMDDQQREYYLREQLKVIQMELGIGGNNPTDEIDDYRQAIADKHLPKEISARLEREVNRLARQPYTSTEAAVLRNYLDTVLELPWQYTPPERVTVASVRRTLEQDHYGMEKVKERILEFVAVKQMTPGLRGQVLCLVGPPGVGKTSIAMSMAKAMHRKLARISLGGVSDEAEIRGHRKTYVGAMPGRIISGILQAGTRCPLMLLDEIDKLGTDRRGDPASALLEVLDGEQNSAFRDNFLEVPFDLSDVIFVTTANTLETIPRPLLDRMEVIELDSYTDEEKLHIARSHLLKKELERHGLKDRNLRITDDAIRLLITGYTREAGVRVLERQLASLCRKSAMKIAQNRGIRTITIQAEDLPELLGPVKYHPERTSLEERVGVVNGLAWTSVGGEMLEVEVNVVPGKGKVELTGNLGAVMKESAQAALSYIRSRAEALGIEPGFYQNRDIHVHFPEGAVPKDGPSAGIAIVTAMVSALTDTPVAPGIAMTGEVTLRGRVLPIGGLKEKTMAAYRNGIRTVIMPAENSADLEEIDPDVRRGISFVLVERADQVLDRALRPAKAPTL